MKTILSLCFALVALAPSHAQIFRPAAVNGALIGGIAGAIIGHNSGNHNAWHGAAIGAGAGLLLGSALDHARYDEGSWRGAHVSPPRGYVYRGTARGHHHHHDRPYYSSGDSYYSRPDYRGSGVLLGGISGAIVGHNSRAFRHNGWRGAAWGAGLGYVFGSIAESNARYRDAVVERPPVYVQAAPAPAPAPVQNITIVNNYYNTPATPMSAANGLFGRN